MDKTPGKVTKDPKRFEAAHKGREKYMKKLKESILNDVKKGSGDTTNARNEATMQTMKLPTSPTPPPQDQVILMSMVLVCLLSLPLALLYFLHITLPRLKIKKPSMKNKINHKNGVICFKKNIE